MTTGAHFGDQAPSTPPPAAAGDAGSNYLSGLLDAPVDEAGAKRVSEGGQKLKALAEGGGFAVSEAAYQRLLAACDAFTEGYAKQRGKLYALTNQVDMGTSDYAVKVAQFNVTVANGDDQSLVPNLEMMADGIQQAREALEIARKNYRATEDAHGQALNAIHRTGS